LTQRRDTLQHSIEDLKRKLAETQSAFSLGATDLGDETIVLRFRGDQSPRCQFGNRCRQPAGQSRQVALNNRAEHHDTFDQLGMTRREEAGNDCAALVGQ
jgi:hypothetical protein